MKFCGTCGKAYEDNMTVCPHCGAGAEEPVQVNVEPTYQEAPQQNYQQTYNQGYTGQQARPASIDSGSVGYAFLGFCIPIVGLILYLVWKDEKPNSAKKAGIGALISVGVSVVIYVLAFIIGIAGTAMM